MSTSILDDLVEAAERTLAWGICADNRQDGKCDCPTDEQIRVIISAALNAAADAVPPSTPPLGGQLAISEPVRMRFQEWLRAQADGAA